MELGRVFISSVFGGMLDLRRKAAESARLIGLEPVLTERHIAQAGAVKDALAPCRSHRDAGPRRRPARRGHAERHLGPRCHRLRRS
jgi:hypothetical protein